MLLGPIGLMQLIRDSMSAWVIKERKSVSAVVCPR